MTRLQIPMTIAIESWLDDLDEYLARLVLRGRLTQRMANRVLVEAWEHFYGVKGV